MIKKVVVCVAGRGSRMKELGEKTPKPLIEVLGKPFLHFLLTNLTNAGFTEIIMVTGHLSEQVEQFMEDSKDVFPHFQTINQFELLGEDKYGTLLPVVAARDLIGDDNFVVVYGDNLFSLNDLENMRKLNGNFHYVAGMSVEDPSRYGTLVSKDDDLLERIDEKVENPVSDIINTGVYTFTPEIYDIIDDVVPNASNGEYYLTSAIDLLAKKDKVKIVTLQDYWLDFGRPDDIPRVEKFIKDNDLYSVYGIEK